MFKRQKTTLLRKADDKQFNNAGRSLKIRARELINKRNMRILAGVMAVATIMIVAFTYVRLQHKNKLRHNPQAQQQAEQANYVKELRKLTYPPEKETPSVAIIADANKARQQNPSFYRQAKDGDVVLVYKSVAYILDVKNHKIVNIGSTNE